MQVRKWLISKSFFMIKSTFFWKKNRRAHMLSIFIYTLVVSFFLESGEHMPISFPKVFFALSAPRRCMRSAAVVERHTPPRTMLGQWLGGSFGPAVLHKGLTFDRPLITGKNHTEIHRWVSSSSSSCWHL